jgi:hypothetical protein
MRARDLFRPEEVVLHYVPLWNEKEGQYDWYWRLNNAHAGSGVSAGRAATHGQAGLKARQAARQHGVRIVKVVVHQEAEDTSPASYGSGQAGSALAAS